MIKLACTGVRFSVRSIIGITGISIEFPSVITSGTAASAARASIFCFKNLPLSTLLHISITGGISWHSLRKEKECLLMNTNVKCGDLHYSGISCKYY